MWRWKYPLYTQFAVGPHSFLFQFSPFLVASTTLRPTLLSLYSDLDCWLDVREIVVRFTKGVRDLFILQIVQTGSGIHSNPLYAGTSSQELRQTEYESDCSPHIIGKSVPLQAWSGPEGSRKLRYPDFMTTAQGVGKVVSPMHRPYLPPGNSPGAHFYWRLSRPQGHSAIGRIMSMKNSNDTIWNPICNTAP
jgi:hypothetical protein